MHVSLVLRRPAFWVAVAVLAVNDHLLKGAGLVPAVLTGKLSDLAGLFFAGALLAVLARPRSARGWLACHALVAAVFTAIKLSVPAATAWDAARALFGLPAFTTVDPTDLLALPMVALGAWWLWPTQQRSPHAPRAGLAVVALGVCAGSDPHPPPPAKAPQADYVASGTAFLVPTTGSIGVSVLTSTATVDCKQLLANPGRVLDAKTFATRHGGLLMSTDTPLEFDEVHTVEQAPCGVALVSGEESTWFGIGSDKVAPTYVIWDRAAVIAARNQQPDGNKLDAGVVYVKKVEGGIALVPSDPSVTVWLASALAPKPPR